MSTGSGSAKSRAKAAERVIYIGTYTSGNSEGIYTAAFDPETGALRLIGSTSGLENPSFLTIDRSGRNLYAVSETESFGELPGGSIAAFSRNKNDHQLTLINRKRSHGGAPCHITLDRTERYVFAANYLGGNLVVIPVTKNGALADTYQVIAHTGYSVHKERQEGPHAHSINLDTGNRFAVAADLGIDRLIVYPFNEQTGVLNADRAQHVAMIPGAGPRHFVFHPDGRHAFAINELNSTITSFSYDPEKGTLMSQSSVSTLPNGFSGENYCADIHVHPSGKFVYGSNRGHDSIAGFSIGENGRLDLLQHQSTLGDWPRNFCIDPSGRFLLVANQRSSRIVVFRLDPVSGQMEPTGFDLEIPEPVCIVFAP